MSTLNLVVNVVLLVFGSSGLVGIMVFYTKAVRNNAKLELTVNGNSEKLKELDDEGSGAFREFLARMEQWMKDFETRDKQRSQRVDKIGDTVNDLSEAMTEVIRNHEGRISRLEGRANSRG